MALGRGRGPKHYCEVVQRLSEIIEKINDKISLVIVEGANDERALKKAGLKSPVARFCESGMRRFEFVDRIAADYAGLTVLVLLDYDKEGNLNAKRITVELEGRGVKINRGIREDLGELLVREGIRRIEEIGSIFAKSRF